jgi:hypothetical protein
MTRTATRPARPASPAQITLLTRLYGERDQDVPRIHDIMARALTGDAGMAEVSTAIDVLFGKPRKPAEPGTLAAPGYYVTSGEESDGEEPPTVYVVVENKAKTATYAKRLVVTPGVPGVSRASAKWEYAPGVGKDLARDGLAPLTVQEAARLGHQHGVCVVCARGLTDPESVARGIGPVCVARLAA